MTPDDRRAQLLALGVETLAERSIDDLTIDAMAERAEVSRALLFHYFGSKEGLHHAVVLAARDGMLHATEPREDLAPLDRLEDTLDRMVGFVRSHRGTFHALVRGASSGDASVRELIDEARDVNAARIVAVFVELGEPDDGALRLVLRAWVAFAEELLVDGALGTAIPAEELVAMLVRSARAVVAAR